MSIWFMANDHITFCRLDDKPVDQAMKELDKLVRLDSGYGLVGCSGEHGNKVFSWRPGKPWRKKVRGLLEWASDE